MLFWLVFLIFAFSWFLILFGCGNRDRIGCSKFLHWVYYKGKYLGTPLSWFSGVILFIMFAILIFQYTGATAQNELDKEKYLSLRYKLDLEYIKGEYDEQTKDVIDEVQEWNEYVAYNKYIQNDFWIGVFYPNVFDNLSRIPLREIK